MGNEKPSGNSIIAGNSIYRIEINTPPDTEVGRFYIESGPDHPAGAGQTFLNYSYNTYHSYSTNTDYVQSDSTSGILLDDSFFEVTTIGTTGVTITYTLSDLPDAFTVQHTVNVHGTTFADTWIEVTNTLINGANPLAIGIRYFYDAFVYDDDGPAFQAFTPAGSVLLQETDFIAPAFEYFKLFDNEPGDYPYSIFQTVNGPNTIFPLPTPPTRLQLAYWWNSFEVPFLYTISDPPTPTDSDAAIIYYWGDTEANAINLLPGASVTVSASFFSQPPPLRGIKLL